MRYLVMTLMILSLVMTAGCGQTSSSQQSPAPEKKEAIYHKITPEEAKKMMDSQKVTVLDVRTQEEYDSGHIAKAKLLPVDTIEASAEAALKDKDATILVYCKAGKRSKAASNILVEKGYVNVYDFGGIQDWPYEIVKTEN